LFVSTNEKSPSIYALARPKSPFVITWKTHWCQSSFTSSKTQKFSSTDNELKVQTFQ
jgi:hypothetical protein